MNKDLFGHPISETEPKNIKGNPLISVYGPGPEGKICKNCKHLWVKKMSGRYLKCDLRPLTAGPGSDHRAKWTACGKYAEDF